MSVQKLLLGTLGDLIEDEFDEFKWYLSLDMLEGCKRFRKGQLQGANRHELVSKMKDNFGEELAVRLTIEVLQNMGKNGNAADLKRDYEALGGKLSTDSASASASASAAAPAAAAPAAAAPPPAAAPPAGVMAQGGSVIIAPAVTGGTSGTWNITVNK